MTTPDPRAQGEGLRPLGRLCQYMNYWRIHERPPVVVTMDHRASLVTAWAAAREGLFHGRAPLLLRLDAHPDMGESPRPWAHEAALLTDLDAVHALVNDQRHDDGGWVNGAMEFGLAGDVVTCFVHEYHRFPGDDRPQVDHRGDKHHIAIFESLKAFLDAATGEWHDADVPLWLDLDLDFATRRLEDDSIALWTDADWHAEFPPQVVKFFVQALRRAALVTIATEPEFCGGLAACGETAERLKQCFASEGDWFARL